MNQASTDPIAAARAAEIAEAQESQRQDVQHAAAKAELDTIMAAHKQRMDGVLAAGRIREAVERMLSAGDWRGLIDAAGRIG